MVKVLYIGLAGFLGTIARYGLSSTVDKGINSRFPIGTLIVNVAGCFLAGLLYAFFRSKYQLDDAVSLVVMVGFLGGFTTFSAFALQSFTLLENGELSLGLTNLVVSNVLGVLAVWIGYSLMGLLQTS